MRIRAYIKKGPHITHVDRLGFRAFGSTVLDEEIDPSIMLPESVLCTGHIPAELLAVIRHYSIYDEFYGGNTQTTGRKIGVYHAGDAEATVERDMANKHKVVVYGKTLSNAAVLLKQILAGSIAPFPSHEDGQVESTVINVKEAAHRLIDAIALAFGQWRLRFMK